MSSNVKPTTILVAGAFHTPQSYDKFINQFISFGYEVHVLRLPTCNESRPPNADLVSNTKLVKGYMESVVRAGRTVIAIGPSCGGQVVSNALCGLGIKTRFAK
ncbi:hypothetical protein F4777DRAFT_595128 [Nemania sp. FL0916]|nr:hypothetical protein F4777DRAFT_595128 [Nemania sp. FL0916]